MEKLWCKFIHSFGSPTKLANANKRMLFDQIRELGFGNQRVEALRSAAQFLLDEFNGQVPAEKERLTRIPHIGLYSAHAVLCFAFNKPVAIVDANVLRLFRRMEGKQVNRLDIRREQWAWKKAQKLLPDHHRIAKEHNYGLLDFVAHTCRPRSPKCRDCLFPTAARTDNARVPDRTSVSCLRNRETHRI